MSYYPQGSWPSSSPDSSGASAFPTKQGIGGFRDSIQSLSDPSSSAPLKKQRWRSLFWKKRRVKNVEKKQERDFSAFSVQSKNLSLSDDALLELLIFLAHHGWQKEEIAPVVQTLMGSLSPSVRRVLVAKDLSEKLLKHIQSVLRIIEETKSSLRSGQLPAKEQLRLVRNMVMKASAWRTEKGMLVVVYEFFALLQGLCVTVREAFVRAFFAHRGAGFWESSITQAMMRSKNPAKVGEIFAKHGGKKERDLRAQEGIQKAIEQLRREDEGALARVLLEYYYVSSLPEEMAAKFQQWVEKHPEQLPSIVRLTS